MVLSLPTHPIPCPQSSQQAVILELWRGSRRVHRRTEYWSPYFLLGHPGADVLDGTILAGPQHSEWNGETFHELHSERIVLPSKTTELRFFLYYSLHHNFLF
jgi:hypothetical protein